MRIIFYTPSLCTCHVLRRSLVWVAISRIQGRRDEAKQKKRPRVKRLHGSGDIMLRIFPLLKTGKGALQPPFVIIHVKEHCEEVCYLIASDSDTKSNIKYCQVVKCLYISKLSGYQLSI